MYRIKKIFFRILAICLTLLQLSCSSKKDIVYFQMDEIDQTKITNNYSLKFKPDDLIQIIISSEDGLSAQPFNAPIITFSNPSSNTLVGQPQMQPYLIDSQGHIELPVIGRIEVAGFTRVQLIAMLKQKLEPFIKSPIVNVNLMNFRISVQGDVARPGFFQISNERVSVLDAISMAGDLNITGKRQNVMIIREERNKKHIYKLDLSSKKIFSSPAYYLQQNDVVYIEPNNAQIQNSTYTRNTGLFISMASVLISLITIITR